MDGEHSRPLVRVRREGAAELKSGRNRGGGELKRNSAVCRRGFGDGGSGAVFAEPAVQGLLFATVICLRMWLASLGFAGSREG